MGCPDKLAILFIQKNEIIMGSIAPSSRAPSDRLREAARPENPS